MPSQTARMGVSAEHEQAQRALAKQARLKAGEEAHARAVADRDACVRGIAAMLPAMQAPAGMPPEGQPLSPDQYARCDHCLICSSSAGLGWAVAAHCGSRGCRGSAPAPAAARHGAASSVMAQAWAGVNIAEAHACAGVRPCSMQSLHSDDCSFADALEHHVGKLGSDADALRAAHARKDDELGRLVDGVTSQLAAAREGMRAKQDLINSSEAQEQGLHSEASAAHLAHAYVELQLHGGA